MADFHTTFTPKQMFKSHTNAAILACWCNLNKLLRLLKFITSLLKSTYSGTPVYAFYSLASILGHQIKLSQGNILRVNTVLVGKTATQLNILLR